ncbi:MAG: hypothetical protein KJ970_02440 [Candidatus Eisenbacteria bacterium]|uniref:Secreted protein n=1 Tax=Eiseniibacteriota bacterium TaxID=2212470 RepID=A0A948RVJ6_UNCEI|nr:hypothetical protein [Candidatus Eisenbacteria bacterium]MBU1949098.1 hypothetical protein [Candidatus Eisenbacteria bacterium]MBU2689757.1 hypothetical protein [Candidatus Eisenbacteria bacterium]
MRILVYCSLILSLLAIGCSSRMQALGDLGDLTHQRYVAPRTSAPDVADPGITGVSLNDDGWIIVEGRGAGLSDKLYVTISGDEQVPMDVRPSADTGEFWVVCPNYFLAVKPERAFTIRIVVGPPSYGNVSRPSMERFVWAGTASVRRGATQH